MAKAERPLLRRVAWLLFALLTAWWCSALPTQAVDPQNRALKEPDSEDARRLRRLAEVVADDPVVLLAFTTAGDLPMLPADQDRLDALRTGLLALPGVVAIPAAPVPDPGLVLLPVAIAGDDLLSVGERVVALARQQTPASLRLLATGLPLLEGTIAKLVTGERTTIVPLLLAVLFAAAWAFYRSPRLALAVLLPPVVGIAWTSGTLAWLGHRLDPIGALLDPVLLTIGVAASVHFVEAFRHGLARGLSAPAAATAAAVELRTPALLATGTTMLGLWSLTTSAVPAVCDFGLRSAMGVGLTHLFGFLILPSWLAHTAVADGRLARPDHEHPWQARLARHRTLLFVAAGIATALATAGLTRLDADNDPLRLLPAEEPARRDHDVLAQRLGGVETCHLLVPADSPAIEPTRLLPFLAEVRQLPGMAGLAGPVQRGREGDLAVPLLLAPGGSATRQPLFASVERIAGVLGFPDVVPVGASVQIANDSHRLLHGLLGSLLVSLALLGVGMAIGLRSWRLAALGLLPNLLPSLWLYGGLGWLGRPVSVATAMIGCTMLGLIVDNTLHLLHHYRLLRERHPRAVAMHTAWQRCWRPMALATTVLMLGFLTAATSRLSTTVEFGLLASATIAAAWFGTAIVLPLLFLAPQPQPSPGTKVEDHAA